MYCSVYVHTGNFQVLCITCDWPLSHLFQVSVGPLTKIIMLTCTWYTVDPHETPLQSTHTSPYTQINTIHTNQQHKNQHKLTH